MACPEAIWVAQVVLAVDDSRSMAENGCGGFALEAVTLLARALARLEVGQLGVLRFGGTDHVRVLHALDAPFSDAHGPNILSSLRFDQVWALHDLHCRCNIREGHYFWQCTKEAFTAYCMPRLPIGIIADLVQYSSLCRARTSI